MAQRQIVSYSYTCDVCGEQVGEEDGPSVPVVFQDTKYKLDLCVTHRGEMEGKIDAANKVVEDLLDDLAKASGVPRRRVGRRPASPPSPKVTGRGANRMTTTTVSPSTLRSDKRGDLPAIRAWAQQQPELSIGDRGRIPAGVIAAYDAAQAPAPEPEAKPELVAAAAGPAKRGRLVAKANGNGPIRVVDPPALAVGSVSAPKPRRTFSAAQRGVVVARANEVGVATAAAENELNESVLRRWINGAVDKVTAPAAPVVGKRRGAKATAS